MALLIYRVNGSISVALRLMESMDNSHSLAINKRGAMTAPNHWVEPAHALALFSWVTQSSHEPT